jgi:hypothetical protein
MYYNTQIYKDKMDQLNNIINDLSIKYSFNSNEAFEFISEKYFKNEYIDIIKGYSIENLIEALKIHSGADRKKHIFSKMKEWNRNDFVKYIKQKNISVDEIKALLIQSVENIELINNEKIKHKEKRKSDLITFIDELRVGDIVDRYIIIEKSDTFAKCAYINNFRFRSKLDEIELHLGCNFEKNNYVKIVSYAYLRNRDPYIARQSWYKLRFYIEVENIHKYKKSFNVGFLNETDKRESQLLHGLLSNINYPLPKDYPDDFNEIPKYFKKEEDNINININNINKLCDILGLDYNDKNNIIMIKQQYKKKALQLHPDKNDKDTTFLFQELNSAYSKLLHFNENN